MPWLEKVLKILWTGADNGNITMLCCEQHVQNLQHASPAWGLFKGNLYKALILLTDIINSGFQDGD